LLTGVAWKMMAAPMPIAPCANGQRLGTVRQARRRAGERENAKARQLTFSRVTTHRMSSTWSSLLDLDDDRRSFVEAIRSFCERELGTREQRRQATADFTRLHNDEIYARMAELGWPGICVPEAYGGSGGGLFGGSLFLEETSRGMAPVLGFGTTVIVAGAYERFGTEEQKHVVLGEIADGSIEAISMSEPNAGSDVARLACRAERGAGGFVINGQKSWCSHAHFSKRILLVARTTFSDDPHHGLTMLSVPADADGLDIRPVDTMGGRELNDLFFTDCYVPESAILGEVDQGWTQLVAGLNVERLAIAAGALGLAERALDDTLAYVKEREQFGRPIGRFQALQHRIADIATEIECCRLLVYGVAAKVDAAPDVLLPREASMAKLKTTEVAKAATLEGLQMMGAYGYATEYEMERYVRMALMLPIFGGTSEIQRNIIAKTYGL
jgi:isovaleryl-CoA dehydrogenase